MGTRTEITLPVEQAHYKTNIDVSVGWVLPVLSMQCCSRQVVRFCGAIPPPPYGVESKAEGVPCFAAHTRL